MVWYEIHANKRVAKAALYFYGFTRVAIVLQ